MQKKKILIILPFLFTSLYGQKFKKYDLYNLSKLVEYSESEIKPIFKDEKMYYTLNGEKINNINYDIAYPFINKSAIVKNDNKYGVINKKGEFLIKPKFNSFSISEYEKGLVIFNDNYAYHLGEAKEKESWIMCEEKAFVNEFMSEKNTKYDTIYFSNVNFLIAEKNGKIGVVNNNGKQISNFIYEKVNHSSPFNLNNNKYSLKRNNKWIYFDWDEKLTESDKECISFSTKIPKSIGVFKVENKFNILFTNGNTLKTNFDYISENGFIGINENKIFLIKDSNSIILFNTLK